VRLVGPLPTGNGRMELRSKVKASRGLPVRSLSGGGGEKKGTWRWFGIPWTLGVACLAVLQFFRILRRDRRLSADGDPVTWQVSRLTTEPCFP
jgi:hypothetical protein